MLDAQVARLSCLETVGVIFASGSTAVDKRSLTVVVSLVHLLALLTCLHSMSVAQPQLQPQLSSHVTQLPCHKPEATS